MGSLTGKAVTLEGQLISVILAADEFEEGGLPSIAGISIQMDGGGEYAPIKITTASIEFLTDSREIIDICRLDYPISVSIINDTKQEHLFKGYVVPNSYNQPMTGVNDIHTIECVDCLGYAKYVAYEQLNAAKGFSAISLSNIAVRCLQLCGAGGRKERIMLPNTVRVTRDVYSAPAMDSIIIGEDTFFNSRLPALATMDYRPQAKTCEEVLAMIAESLRLTWVSNGLDVYLIDALSASVGDVPYYDALTHDAATLSTTRVITEDSFAPGASNVSSLPRISMTEIEHSRADEVSVMQDPFDETTLVKDGAYKESYNATVDAYSRVISVPLRSKIYDTYLSAQSGEDGNAPPVYSQFVAWRENKSVVPSPGTITFLDDYAWGDGNWNIALKMCDTEPQTVRELLRRKIQFSTPVIGEPRGLTKNAARVLQIGAEVVIAKLNEGEKDSDGSKGAFIKAQLWPQNAESIDCKLLVSVIVNGLYYNPSEREYTAEQAIFAVNIYKDGTASWAIYGLDDKMEGIPIPNSGTIELVVYSNGNYDAGWDVAWLKQLTLVIRSDSLALREDLARPSIERTGLWLLNRTQRVSLPIDIYYYLTNIPASTDKLDNDYHGRPTLYYLVDDENLSAVEYIHRLANVGDRIMYELPINESTFTSGISPYDAFACDLWNSWKVATGYTRDVLNDKIILILV